MKRIYEASFKYTPAAQTDIRKTRMKWLRDYARDWDAAHAENAFRNMVPQNVSALTIKKGVKNGN